MRGDPTPQAVTGPAMEPANTSATFPKVRLRGVSKRFWVAGRPVDALADIKLDIRGGEFLCIVGPSGCGKTTLLRILAGLETQTSGTIEIYGDPGTGRDGSGGPATERPLNSLVFQELSIFPWMSVRDNVAFGLKARGFSRARRHAVADEFIHKVGLGGFEDALPYQLSGGMKQRVSIVRAFANDPEMLLMDEPFAALDEQTKLLLQAELLRIWEESRKTVVYVTHSIDEAIVLADRILVMTARPGRAKDLVEVGQVFGRPRDVAAVKGSAQYGELFSRIWGQLRDEVAAAQAAEAARTARHSRAAAPGAALTPPAAPTTPISPPAPDAGRALPPAPVARLEPPARERQARWATRANLERLLSVLSPVVLLALWELAALAGQVDTRFFPSPSSIFSMLGRMVHTGELWGHLSISLTRIGIGFALGALPGVIVGLAMGLLSPVRAIIQPLVDGTFPIPKIAILPLFIMLFGIGEESKYAIIAVAVIYLVLINTVAGVRNIERIYLDVGKNYRASPLMMFTDVALPGALPLIVAGLRLGMGVALLVIVAAEFVGARSGIGFLIWTSWQTFQVEKLYVGLLITALLGFGSAILLDLLERALIPWKQR